MFKILIIDQGNHISFYLLRIFFTGCVVDDNMRSKNVMFAIQSPNVSVIDRLHLVDRQYFAFDVIQINPLGHSLEKIIQSLLKVFDDIVQDVQGNQDG